MWNTVKGLGKIQDDHVCLNSIVQERIQVVYKCDQLYFTTPSPAETVLASDEDMMEFHMLHDIADDDINVKKDCLWRQRTHKLTKIGDSV